LFDKTVEALDFVRLLFNRLGNNKTRMTESFVFGCSYFGRLFPSFFVRVVIVI
jgi:hypothetical protein